MEDIKTCCTYREKTLGEEIAELDIDKDLKERLLKKWSNCVKYSDKQDRYLSNCQRRIDELERAIIEIGVGMGKCNYNMRLGMD